MSKLEETFVGPMWLLEDSPGASVVSSVSRAIRQGNHELESLAFLGNYLQPNMVGLDVGANVGLYSVFAAQKIGKGTVYAFEPHPVLYLDLEKNAKLYGFRSFNFGLWDRVGSLMGWLDGYTDTKYPFCVSIGDEVLRDVQKVDFLKIDVEGAEVGVLRGLQSLLKRSPELFIIIELYNGGLERFGSSMEEFFILIESLDLEYGRIVSENLIDLKNNKEKFMKLYTPRSYCNLLLWRGIRSFWKGESQ